MSDANLATIAFAPETTLGTPAPALQELRFTRESLRFEKETVSSQEIRSDRQVSDNQKVHGQPSGGFDFELSYLFILPWLAAALHADWLTIAISETLVLDATGQTATGPAGTFDDVPVGALLVFAGAATSGNNGAKRVTAKTADGSAITLAAGSIAANETTALTVTGKNLRNGITRKSFTLEKRILNGEGDDFYQRYLGMVVDQLSFQIESKRIITGSATMVGTAYNLNDDGSATGAVAPAAATGVLTITDLNNATAEETVTIGDTTYTFKAAAAAAGEVTIGADAEATLVNLAAEINGTGLGDPHPLVTANPDGNTLNFTAINEGALGNSIATTETMVEGSFADPTLTGGATQAAGYLDAELGPIMNGTSNLGTIQMDGETATDRFKRIGIQISNNTRGKDACGFDGNWDVGLGQFTVTGNLNAYFRNNLLPQRIRDHTTFSLEFYVQDAAGNRLYFYLPSVKPASGDPLIEAINTDVMIDTAYEAIRGGAENPTGATLIVDAVPA